MPDNVPPVPPLRPEEEALTEEVGRKEERKLRARREKEHGIWFGLGMFGLVGWTVAVPTVAGALLGYWIDHRWPGQASWTLIGMVTGVIAGCLHAWQWLSRASSADRMGEQPDRDP